MKNKQQHIVSERFQKQTGKSWKHVKSITKHKYNEDKFEDTKGVIRICKWKKDRQIILHNPTGARGTDLPNFNKISLFLYYFISKEKEMKQ